MEMKAATWAIYKVVNATSSANDSLYWLAEFAEENWKPVYAQWMGYQMQKLAVVLHKMDKLP